MWSLLTALTDDPVIKQGLFPGQGGNASTVQGGGKKKIDHQYQLATAIFENHMKYSSQFKLATEPKQRTNKIKNRLNT
jgi:hypothetical protein